MTDRILGTFLRGWLLVLIVLSPGLIGCSTDAPTSTAASSSTTDLECDADLTLPDGFCATVFADDLGRGRHLTVTETGDVYLFLRQTTSGGGIVALRDRDSDGKADRIEYFSNWSGTGIEVHGGYLYVSPGDRVVRYPLQEGELVPDPNYETVVSELFAAGSHSARPITFDDDGHFYVNVGAPSNNCMKQSRTRGSPGQDPCPLLDYSGGIWRYTTGDTHQSQTTAVHYARGIRNAVAIDWNPEVGELFAVQHGRDQLHQFFPDLYTVEENARLPAEELLLVERGSELGWPYCYYDQRKGHYVLAPEYGGDGKKVGRCDKYPEPKYGFPGHWAPNDLLFYTGESFPDRYRGGAFVAFHGSWNRAPLPQAGFNVSFVPFKGSEPTVEEPEGHQVFADGFAGSKSLSSPGQAEFRPTGLAQGPDGALYVADSQQGRIWKITYTGP